MKCLNMRHAMFWLLVTIARVATASTPPDALLAAAQEQLKRSVGLVADNIRTEMEMFEGGIESLGTMRIEERIAGWKDDVPVREIIYNSNPEHAAVAKARFKILIDNHPEQSLRVGTVLQRTAETFNGTRCIVFRTEQKQGAVSINSRIWVEEASGMPARVEHEFSGIPMTKKLSHTISFAKGADGKVLPKTALVDTTVGLLFQNLRIVSKYTFVSWTRRP